MKQFGKDSLSIDPEGAGNTLMVGTSNILDWYQSNQSNPISNALLSFYLWLHWWVWRDKQEMIILIKIRLTEPRQWVSFSNWWWICQEGHFCLHTLFIEFEFNFKREPTIKLLIHLVNILYCSGEMFCKKKISRFFGTFIDGKNVIMIFYMGGILAPNQLFCFESCYLMKN